MISFIDQRVHFFSFLNLKNSQNSNHFAVCLICYHYLHRIRKLSAISLRMLLAVNNERKYIHLSIFLLILLIEFITQSNFFSSSFLFLKQKIHKMKDQKKHKKRFLNYCKKYTRKRNLENVVVRGILTYILL